MRSIFFGAKSKKGFTLVELIAVMAIMAIAASILVPNLSGVISRAEESKYKSYCAEATSYVRGHTNLLTLGETKIPYEVNGSWKDEKGNPYEYDISTPNGLRSVLNEYNLESNYQFHVLAFEDTSATTNPTSKVKDLIKKNTLAKKDVMITVITTSSNGRVPKYTLQGFWYYSYAQESIVYSYYSPKKWGGMGYQKLTSEGK